MPSNTPPSAFNMELINMKNKFRKNNERARIASSFFRLRGEIKIERMSGSIFFIYSSPSFLSDDLSFFIAPLLLSPSSIRGSADRLSSFSLLVSESRRFPSSRLRCF